MGFLRFRGTFIEVPEIKIMAFGGPYWSPLPLFWETTMHFVWDIWRNSQRPQSQTQGRLLRCRSLTNPQQALIPSNALPLISRPLRSLVLGVLFWRAFPTKPTKPMTRYIVEMWKVQQRRRKPLGFEKPSQWSSLSILLGIAVAGSQFWELRGLGL